MMFIGLQIMMDIVRQIGKVFNIIELLLNHFSTSFSASVLKKRTYSDHVNFSMETTVLETFTA